VYDGRITLEKGFDTMLSVTDIVRREIQNFKLLMIGEIIGASQERRSMLRRIRELDLEKNVEVTGWIPYHEVPKYINLGKMGLSLLKAWCYSYRITEPYKILEIMSCGKPVIATEENLVGKSLIQQSEGGVLVDQSDVQGIADCVIHLLRDNHEREQMGLKARKFVENRRQWSDFEEKLLSVYKVCANRVQ